MIDHDTIIDAIPMGRDNAISIRALADLLPGRPGRRTVRRAIHHLQVGGVDVLSSPRSGVWISSNIDERLDVMDELREMIGGLEKRIAAINGGRCAMRSCRVELPKKVARRGGLYCCAEHRYQAAQDRDRRHP